MKPIALLLCLFLVLSVRGDAQDRISLRQSEDSLSSLSKKILQEPSDSIRLLITGQFTLLLKNTLSLPGSFSYPFDSLTTLSKLVSPDKSFRLYNWNMPMNDGSNRYFCLIQIPGVKKKPDRLIEMTDRSDSIADPESAILIPASWYGALYYRIVMVHLGKKTLYTLLGWDGFSSTVSQKLIDILSFDPNGNPRFGAKVFREYRKGQPARIIFRYAASATMLLRPDIQSVKSGSSEKKTPMILCDRLVPLDPRMEGQTDFYIPASDIYDGFVWTGTYWKFIRSIEGRNR